MATVIANAAVATNQAFKALVITDLHCMKAGTADPVAGAGDFCQTRMADLLVQVQKYGPYTNLINLGDTIHGAPASGTLAEQLAPYITFDTGLRALYPSIVRSVLVGNHDNIAATNNTAQFLAACPGATTGDSNIVLGGDFLFYFVDVQVKNGNGGAYALTSAQQTALIAFLVANPTKKVIIGMHVPYAITKEIDRYYISGSSINPRTSTAYSLSADMMVDAAWFYSLEQTYPNIAQFWTGHWHLTSGPTTSDPTIERPQVIFPAVSGRNNIPPPLNPWYGQRAGFAVVTGDLNGNIFIQPYYLT